MTELWFEDLSEGQRFISSTLLVTEADILEFAREFDPQPMHTDAEWARSGPLRGLIASGWHTAAIAMTLQRETGLPGVGLTEIASLAWPTPVRAGDEVHVEVEIKATAPAPSHPDHGLVHFHNTVLNKDGTTVQIIMGAILVPRRMVVAE